MNPIRVDGYSQELNENTLKRYRNSRNRTPKHYIKIRSDFISFLADIFPDDSRDRIIDFMLKDGGVSRALAHMCKIEGISFRSMIIAVLLESNHLDENDIEFHRRI